MTRDMVWLDLGRAAYDGGVRWGFATGFHVSAAVRDPSNGSEHIDRNVL
jgi:hypothetical protein